MFAILHTADGKGSCYGCIPLVFDKLMNTEGDHSSIVVVVTPLTAIMKYQVFLNSYSTAQP